MDFEAHPAAVLQATEMRSREQLALDWVIDSTMWARDIQSK